MQCRTPQAERGGSAELGLLLIGDSFLLVGERYLPLAEHADEADGGDEHDRGG